MTCDFGSFSVISGRCVGGNERLHAMEHLLRLKIFSLQARIEPGTARSTGSRERTPCPSRMNTVTGLRN